MATIGQALTAPEAGWKRYDNTNNFITYQGTWVAHLPSSAYNSTSHYTGKVNDFCSFSFIGTKLRVIGSHHSSRSKSIDIFIDGVKVATFSQYNTSTVYQALGCEITGLDNKKHYVKIVNNATGGTGGYFEFDAIDIDSTGDLVALVASPTNLIAIANNSQVNLSWNTISEADSYNIKRSTTSGGPYTTISTNITGTTYVDNTVTNGITYYYVVTAIDGSGNESANSNEASATPQASSGNALLRVTMNDSSEREYQLSIAEIDGFIKWVKGHGSTDSNCYMLNKVEVLRNSKEYLMFEKIISFEVMELTK